MTGSPHGNGGQRHCHGNCIEHALRAKALYESCRGDRISPVCSRFGSEDPQRRSVDEMALNIEGIVNCTVHAEKPPATPTECRVGAGPACREPRPKRGRYLSRTLAFARNHERSMNRKLRRPYMRSAIQRLVLVTVVILSGHLVVTSARAGLPVIIFGNHTRTNGSGIRFAILRICWFRRANPRIATARSL